MDSPRRHGKTRATLRILARNSERRVAARRMDAEGVKGVAAIDGWTAVHLASGVGLAAIGASRFMAYGLIILVELLELFARTLGVAFFRESARNVAADIAAGIIGYELSRIAGINTAPSPA